MSLVCAMKLTRDFHDIAVLLIIRLGIADVNFAIQII